jgi:hypothetical protein
MGRERSEWEKDRLALGELEKAEAEKYAQEIKDLNERGGYKVIIGHEEHMKRDPKYRENYLNGSNSQGAEDASPSDLLVSTSGGSTKAKINSQEQFIEEYDAIQKDFATRLSEFLKSLSVEGTNLSAEAGTSIQALLSQYMEGDGPRVVSIGDGKNFRDEVDRRAEAFGKALEAGAFDDPNKNRELGGMLLESIEGVKEKIAQIGASNIPPAQKAALLENLNHELAAETEFLNRLTVRSATLEIVSNPEKLGETISKNPVFNKLAPTMDLNAVKDLFSNQEIVAEFSKFIMDSEVQKVLATLNNSTTAEDINNLKQKLQDTQAFKDLENRLGNNTEFQEFVRELKQSRQNQQDAPAQSTPVETKTEETEKPSVAKTPSVNSSELVSLAYLAANPAMATIAVLAGKVDLSDAIKGFQNIIKTVGTSTDTVAHEKDSTGKANQNVAPEAAAKVAQETHSTQASR